LFSIVDDKKSAFAKTARYRADKIAFNDWSTRWSNVCDVLEKCLQIQNRRLKEKPGRGQKNPTGEHASSQKTELEDG
jgi:hypothetical protein